MEVLKKEDPPAAGSSETAPSILAADTMVGFEEDLKKLANFLTGGHRKRQVIPVVGMSGSGKTTLSRKVYDLVKDQFDGAGWITISQQYEVKQLMLGLLRFVPGVFIGETDRMSEEQLEELLRRRLKRIRYLIVLDNICDTLAWDALKNCFSNNKNGSRIMLTSRLIDVAVHASSSSSNIRYIHHMQGLSKDESWLLLRSKVFPNRSCPPELEEIGKKIAKRCKGLPLALVVIAGLLFNRDKTRESWEEVEESLSLLLTEFSEDFSAIFSLSYSHLPQSLKNCYLHMGVFLEDFEIPTWKLIWLWIAEGFVETEGAKSLEEQAEEFVNDLIRRNLIQVAKSCSDGRIKTCRIHDQLRDLCLREAQKEKFLVLIKRYEQVPLAELDNFRRLSFHCDFDDFVFPLPPLQFILSFMCFVASSFPISLLDLKFSLLRVLDLELVQCYCFPNQIVQLVNLRYLAIGIDSNIPESLSELLNLQTLIINLYTIDLNLPQQIWNMPQIRHLRLKKGCHLPIPFGSENGGEGHISLPNLQTLAKIKLDKCTSRALACTHNVKKLEIAETEDHRIEELFLDCFANLNQLEMLKCFFRPYSHSAFRRNRLPNWDVFPPNLKKLTLAQSFLPWEDMSILGMLPNLEELKLKDQAFWGTNWETIEGGFKQLRLLLIMGTNLQHWHASVVPFPILKRLVLKKCYRLIHIPLCIGDICTLETIELQDCGISVEVSAMRIQKAQAQGGNECLRIYTTHSDWSY